MWEYKTIELITIEPMAIQKALNDLGKVNWELISYAFADEGATSREGLGFLIAGRENLPDESRVELLRVTGLWYRQRSSFVQCRPAVLPVSFSVL